MQIIDNIKMLASVDHIAWADGPLWLLSSFVLGFMLLVIGAARSPST